MGSRNDALMRDDEEVVHMQWGKKKQVYKVDKKMKSRQGKKGKPEREQPFLDADDAAGGGDAGSQNDSRVIVEQVLASRRDARRKPRK